MSLDRLATYAQAIIDTNRYLTLATADQDGRPWATPVYFAPAGLREYYWTSTTDARHSRNLAECPQASIVIFDSTVAPYHGRAVYAVVQARELSGDDLDPALEIYPGADSRGATPLTREEVTMPSPPVPPLPGDGVRPVGALSARAKAAVPAAWYRPGSPGPRRVTGV